jgi:hypothetical protein
MDELDRSAATSCCSRIGIRPVSTEPEEPSHGRCCRHSLATRRTLASARNRSLTDREDSGWVRGVGSHLIGPTLRALPVQTAVLFRSSAVDVQGGARTNGDRGKGLLIRLLTTSAIDRLLRACRSTHRVRRDQRTRGGHQRPQQVSVRRSSPEFRKTLSQEDDTEQSENDNVDHPLMTGQPDVRPLQYGLRVLARDPVSRSRSPRCRRRACRTPPAEEHPRVRRPRDDPG